MLVDYVKTTYICSTQQLHDNSLPLIPTPPLIMAVNIGAAECRPLPSDPPWSMVPGTELTIASRNPLQGTLFYILAVSTFLTFLFVYNGEGNRCSFPVNTK